MRKFRKTKSGIYTPDTQSSLCLPEEIDTISRRQLLATGSSVLGYVSLASLLGMQSSKALGASFPPKKRLVWISMTGGWDILEITDPKVSSTANIDMSYEWGQAHEVGSSGEKIGRFLPKIAALGDELLVVRGLNMATTSHNAGRVFADTGIRNNTGEVNGASIPAIIASESSATIPIIQLQGGADPQTDRAIENSVSIVRANNLNLFKSMYPSAGSETDRAVEMLDYIKTSIARMQTDVGTNDRLSNLSTAEVKVRAQLQANLASQLTVTATDRAAYQTGAPATLSTNDIDSFALAEKLLQNNLVTTVNLGMGGFDTHSNQTTRLQPVLERFDHLLSTFVAQLSAAGKLDDTLIVVYSDFGRTPKVNNSNGRDHWPVGGALMIGGGIDGGRVVGGTTDGLQVEKVNVTSGAIDSSGTQIDPSYIGGSVLEMVLGSDYLQYRQYLNSIAALTKLK